MITSVEVRCLNPLRRDALEEAARLVLSFVSVSSRPGYRLDWRGGALRLRLSPQALRDGCYLPESAQQLLEAAQSFGVHVVRDTDQGDIPEEWESWWAQLPLANDSAFELSLEIR